MKEKPKQTESEKANPSPSEPVGNGAAANQGAQGAGACNYFREQVRRFISELPKDCAFICDTVKNSLYDDGAGLLEDVELYKPLGRIAYIDNFIRYFGAYLAVEDVTAFIDDLLPSGLYTAGGAVDMKKLERVPELDRDLLKDILDTGDDETSMKNLTLYFFALWVNFHVAPVVSSFRKWVDVYGENVPPVLRDMSELARCVCFYTRTVDNSIGGVFYDGAWFESFAMCGERKRKSGAAADCHGAKSPEPVARPNPSAAQGANPSARDTANPSEPVGNGAAQIRGAEMIAGEIRDLAKVIQAAQPNPPQGANPSEPKKKNAGHCGGMSQADFAGLLKHYGGKCHGEPYTARTVKGWERKGATPPTAGGVKYSANLRKDIIAARKWAMDFNTEKANAYKARKSRV